MGCCNAYESETMREAMGETLRPGGFTLTEKGVRHCGITVSDSVLDLGCGRGATVNYLYQKHNIRAVGIDPSEKLIKEAKERYGYADFFSGRGENLPFGAKNFSCIFAECTLSLMDVSQTLPQVNRVLKDGGWFIITDVYAKNPDAVSGLNEFSINSCMRGLHNLPRLQEELEQAGFQISLLEDCSHFLKELLVKITFSYGSMSAFWNITSQDCINGCGFQESLKKCKPGYFILICRKAGLGRG